MEYTEDTMEFYIRKEKSTCREVIANRKKNLEPFIKIMKDISGIKRIIFLATGSSANAVFSAKYYIEELLNIETEVKLPFLFSNYQKIYDSDALVIGVSQSGKSYSTIEAVKKADELGYKKIIGLTADLNSPMAKEMKQVIDIGCGNETVGYVTMGFSATLLTLMLMAAEGAYAQEKISKEQYETEIRKLEAAVDKIDDVIEKTSQWYDRNKQELKDGQRFATVAYGSCVGTAMESCTKLTETVRCPSTAHELEEYMHGPYLELNQDHFLIFIKHQGKLEKRLSDLKDYIKNVSEHCFTISYKSKSEDRRTLALDLQIGENISPLLYIIPFQLLSYWMATDRKIDLRIDAFPDFDTVLKSKIQ